MSIDMSALYWINQSSSICLGIPKHHWTWHGYVLKSNYYKNCTSYTKEIETNILVELYALEQTVRQIFKITRPLLKLLESGVKGDVLLSLSLSDIVESPEGDPTFAEMLDRVLYLLSCKWNGKILHWHIALWHVIFSYPPIFRWDDCKFSKKLFKLLV